MPGPQPSQAPAVYPALADEPNLAVESALLEALPDLEPDEQSAALDLLIARRRQRGLLQLVGNFTSYDQPLQEMILARTHGLYAGARLAIGSDDAEVRSAAVELIRRSGDCKLAYLLGEALRAVVTDARTRERAGAALHEVTARFLIRRGRAIARGCVGPDLQSDADYLARALRQAVECWELHFRTEVLVAALWLGEELEDQLFDRAAAPRSNLARAMSDRLCAPDDARLAGFALRALRSPQLRASAVRTIETAAAPEFVGGLAAESWLLADPQVGRACQRVRRMRWLEDGTVPVTDLPCTEQQGIVRLIAAAGMPSDLKVRLYGQFLSAEAEQADAIRWTVFGKLVDLGSEAANCLLRDLARRGDDPLSAAAARELNRRGCDREAAAGPLDLVAVLAGDQPLDFDAFWRHFDRLDDDTREQVCDAVRRDCPDLAVCLKGRLASADSAERGKALRVVRALSLAGAVADDIFRLASDAEAMVRSQAVALLADIGGAVARRILGRTLDDPDMRVQANAIEALDALDLPQGNRQIVAKLDAPHHRVRATAVAALLRMQVPRAAETLLDMLESELRAERISALWVIDRLRLASMVHRLADLAKRDPDRLVRRRADRLLRAFPAGSPPLAEAIVPGCD